MIVITHWDPDGIFCLYLLYKAYNTTNIKVYFSGPRKIENTLIKAIKENDKNESILIADIAATQEAIYLSSYFKEAIWIDHHVWPNFELTSRVIIYNKPYRSAARVVAEYFKIQDPYIDFIDDIDSNTIKNDEERKFRDLIAAIRNEYPRSYRIWFIEIAKKLYTGKSPSNIINEYLSILERFYEVLSKIKDNILLKTNVFNFNGKEFFIVEGLSNIPSYYIVELLIEKLKKPIDYVIILYGNRVEIRTTTNKDVLKIAKEFGGGGHKYAAGFYIESKEQLLNKLKEISKNI